MTKVWSSRAVRPSRLVGFGRRNERRYDGVIGNPAPSCPFPTRPRRSRSLPFQDNENELLSNNLSRCSHGALSPCPKTHDAPTERGGYSNHDSSDEIFTKQ